MFIVRCQLPRLTKSTSTSQYYAGNGFKTDAVSERVTSWDRAVMSEFNSRLAPEAPILLLAVLREIFIANFKMVPRTARQTADFDFVIL
jgi:hypothetical protein